MGGIDVAAADNKQALKEFIEFPYTLYRDNPYWVPPLRIAVKDSVANRRIAEILEWTMHQTGR